MDEGAAVTPPFLLQGSGPGPGALGAAPYRVPPVPVALARFARCGRLRCAARARGPFGLVPLALFRLPFVARPRYAALGLGPSGAAGRPSLGSRLPPGGGLRAALARGAQSSPPGCGCSACGLGLALRGASGLLRSPSALSGLALRPAAPPPGPPAGPLRAGPGGPPSLLPPPGLGRGCGPGPCAPPRRGGVGPSLAVFRKRLMTYRQRR